MKYLLIIISGIAAFFLLDQSLEINTAAAEAHRWREVIISNKTFLFFFNLMMIGAVGGFIGSKYKKQPKIRFTIMGITWLIIYMVGFGLSQITTLPVDAGPK
jgi:hypothetical protein